MKGGDRVKRDMDLVRDILLLIESNDSYDFEWFEPNFDGLNCDYHKIWYHIKIMVDGGLLECEKAEKVKYANYHDSLYITAKGYEFLDCVRNADIWRTVKERIAVVGGAPSDVIMLLANRLIRERVR
jgi:hypothetical protein